MRCLGSVLAVVAFLSALPATAGPLRCKDFTPFKDAHASGKTREQIQDSNPKLMQAGNLVSRIFIEASGRPWASISIYDKYIIAYEHDVLVRCEANPESLLDEIALVAAARFRPVDKPTPQVAESSSAKPSNDSALRWMTKKTTPEEAATEQASKQKAEQACRHDINCWGDKKAISAGFDCKRPIERLAKYEHEWTDGWLDMKMSRFAWNDKDKGIVTYWGDKIRFKNGLGGWLPHA